MSADGAAPRKGRKFNQVLDGARTVFLRDGFEGASVDEIARVAAVSKATLYSYFADKKVLFAAVAKAECRRQANDLVGTIDQTQPCEAVLREIGRRLISFLVSDFGIRMFRICVAESDRFPQIGREYYQSGPAFVRQRIAAYLARAVERGELAIDDVDLAADQFAQLCKANVHPRQVFGAGGATARAQKRTLDGAVAMFMACYGKAGPAAPAGPAASPGPDAPARQST